jgi:hypothetical protein
MAARKALVTSSGTTQQILDADTLAVGAYQAMKNANEGYD